MSKQCSTVIDSQDPLMILNILWKKFTSRTKPTVILLVFLFYLCFMYFEIGNEKHFYFSILIFAVKAQIYFIMYAMSIIKVTMCTKDLAYEDSRK